MSYETASQTIALLIFAFTLGTIITAIVIVRRNPMHPVKMTKEQATAYKRAARAAQFKSTETMNKLNPPLSTQEPV